MHAEYFAPVRPWLATGLRMQAELVEPTHRRVRARAAPPRRPGRPAAPIVSPARTATTCRMRCASGRPWRRPAGAQGPGQPLVRGQPARQRGPGRRLREPRSTREAMARLDIDRGRFLDADRLERGRSSSGSASSPRNPRTPLITYSLADRFEQLLDVGRRIGPPSLPSDVYQELHQAALLMLRGDHCNVVRIGDAIDDPLVSDSGSMVPDISPSLMRQAIEQMAPVVSSAMGDTDDYDSHAAGRPAVHLVRAHRLGGSGRGLLQRHPSPGRRPLRRRRESSWRSSSRPWPGRHSSASPAARPTSGPWPRTPPMSPR